MKLRSDIASANNRNGMCHREYRELYMRKNFLEMIGKRAAVTNIRILPTATFQTKTVFRAEYCKDAAIFGDGCACCLLSSYKKMIMVLKYLMKKCIIL